MDDAAQVFVLRVYRTSNGEHDRYDTIWDVKAVPNAVVHHVLDHLREFAARPVDGVYGVATVSHYGECGVSISKGAEEFPF